MNTAKNSGVRFAFAITNEKKVLSGRLQAQYCSTPALADPHSYMLRIYIPNYSVLS
jgi:hypothetical protein